MLQHTQIRPAPRADGSLYGPALQNNQLKELEQALALKEQELSQMQVTLKHVLQTIDTEKKDFKSEFAQKIRVDLLPALEKMAREETRDIRHSYKEVIRDQLAELTSGANGRLDKDLLKLTATEIRICRYIQSGQGTKQIAEMTHSAFETVQTHRKNIRRKLGLKGKRVTLYAYLKTKAFPELGEE